MADEKSVTNEPTPAVSAEQKSMMKKLQDVMPGAKVHEPKENGNYYGAVLFANKHFVVQQVGDNTAVAHPRKEMGELPLDPTLSNTKALTKLAGTVVDVKYDGKTSTVAPADPERWNERMARTPASEQHTELARAHLGPNVGVFNPPSADKGLSPRYEGVVVAVNDTHLVQRINSRTAIVHAVDADTAKAIGVGQQVGIEYDNGSLKKVEEIARQQSQAKAQDKGSREAEADRSGKPASEAERRNSFHFGRKIVLGIYGEESKIYDAIKVDGEKGKFGGPIVAVTDHHAIQRVGKAAFISHEKSLVQGEIKRGKSVDIQYQNGRATVAPRQLAQQQAQQRQHSRPEPARSQSQGMSR